MKKDDKCFYCCKTKCDKTECVSNIPHVYKKVGDKFICATCGHELK